MMILGSIIALAAALVFALLGGVLFWGGWVSVRRELLRSFVVANPPLSERLTLLLLVAAPLFAAALLSLLAAGRIALVAVGAG